MKKCLFVVDEKMMGGVSLLLEDFINMINFKDVKIDVLVLHNRGEMFESIKDKVNIFYGSNFFKTIDIPIKLVLKSKNISNIINKMKLVFYMKTGLIMKKIKKERKKIIKEEYDVEIAFKDGFTALFTCVGNASKKIHWLHSEYEICDPVFKYRKLFCKVYREFDTIVAVSSGAKKGFNSKYGFENKTIVINNIVNVERILANASLSSFKKDKNLNLISVGRLHFQKGYDILIKIFDRLNRENLLNNVVLKIYGDGPDKEMLGNLVSQYNLEDKVLLMGQTMNPYKEIKKSDLFILSSRYESFGLVVVEALVLGVPVIATSNAATSDLIDNEKNGLIVNNDEESLYFGLCKLLKERKIIDEYKKNLDKYSYDNEKSIKQIKKLIEK